MGERTTNCTLKLLWANFGILLRQVRSGEFLITTLEPVAGEKSSDSSDFLLVLLKPFPQSHVPSSTNCPLPAIDLSDFPHAIKL